jgi:RimJ/RimL family protein N-acetyltransferase
MATLPLKVPHLDRLNLQTSRLDLVPINREHAASMFSVLIDPALYEFTGGSPPVDIETLALKYEYWESRTSPDGSELWLNWVIRLRDSGKLIGHVQAGLDLTHADGADVAWIVGSRWQKHGYATEAAKRVVDWVLELEVPEIRASINPENTASIKVAERAGLVRTNEFSRSELIWKLCR